jgi:small subunit ribosomal protein S19
MTRSKWKHSYINQNIFYKLKDDSVEEATVFKIWDRRSEISEQFHGLTFNIYNGNSFIPLKITSDHIGHKFGEFAPTRKPCVFKKKSKKKKK